MKSKVEWDGLAEFMKVMASMPGKFRQAASAALYQEGEELMAESKPLVPVDEGTLRASGFVDLPVDENGELVVNVGFGGPAGSGNQGGSNTKDVGYAVYVHENLLARHTVGQAKYLEQPLNKRKPGYSARIAQRINKKIK
jgi:hypothetical protein